MANTLDQEISLRKQRGAAALELRGVVAATTSISDVNAERGELIYQGFNIHDLAEHSTFEEVLFLFWNGRLPKRAELDELKQSLAASYQLPEQITEMIKGMAARVPANADPMDRLRTVVSALAMFDEEAGDLSREASIRVATRLTAQLPTIVAAIDRTRNNLELIEPKPDLNIATNFLYMLNGEMPDEFDAHVLDVALILQADHELNASTFTARVVAGTLANMYSAVTAAIGALSGPLHGGANTAIMKILLEIASVDHVEGYVKDALSKKKKIMGFGHPVYKTEDPRATHLRRFSKEIGERKGNTKWYDITAKLEAIMKREKGLLPNVDAYSASTYYMMGIPLDLYTPIFAISRISGWTAHILEQYANNKMIRPRAEYVGPRGLKYVPQASVVKQTSETFEALKSETRSTEIVLEHQQGDSSPRQMTAHYLASTIIPYIRAISDLQRIIDEIHGSEQAELVIKQIKQNSPISIDLGGGTQAIQMIKETIVPWRRKHAKKMADLLEREKQTEIGSRKAEILEKRARATREKAEVERITAEATHKREETERLKLENEKLRIELRHAQILLALEVLASIAPNLVEAERRVYVNSLLAPLEILISSELEIVTSK